MFYIILKQGNLLCPLSSSLNFNYSRPFIFNNILVQVSFINYYMYAKHKGIQFKLCILYKYKNTWKLTFLILLLICYCPIFMNHKFLANYKWMKIIAIANSNDLQNHSGGEVWTVGTNMSSLHSAFACYQIQLLRLK